MTGPTGLARRSRAGTALRREARQRTIEVLLTPRPIVFVLGGLAFVVLMALSAQALATSFGDPIGPTVFGFLLGASVASVLWAARATVTSIDGSATWRAGRLGEEQTAAVLARLDDEWSVIHHVPFQDGFSSRSWEVDVDHVAVGPPGVLVFETKYTTSTLDLSDLGSSSAIRVAADQAQKNARRVTALLGPLANDVMVMPVVVYWGLRVTAPVDIVGRLGGVRVVAGGAAQEWLPMLSTNRLDPARREELTRRLMAYVVGYQAKRRRDATDPESVEHSTDLARWWSIGSIGWTALLAGTLFLADRTDSVRTLFKLTMGAGRGLGALMYVFSPIVPIAVAWSMAWRVRGTDRPMPVRWPVAATTIWALGVAALLTWSS